MGKATAIAPSNIAFIKYWGKKNAQLRLPSNSSISMNLDACVTTTTVEFSSHFKSDSAYWRDESNGLVKDIPFSPEEAGRVTAFLDRVRAMAGMNYWAKTVTMNSFPKSAGIASSASGFAALALAASKAAGLSLKEKELSILARLGSGSACRSIPDGFVEWEAAETGEASYAHSLFPSTYWDIRDVIAIVESKEKDTPSSRGHQAADTSPEFPVRQKELPGRIKALKESLKEKNFTRFGQTLEEDAISMHRVMQTQVPALNYWNEITVRLMESVCHWRSSGLLVYFTIDAGPNVHCICQGNDAERIIRNVQGVVGVKTVIVNKPALGVRIVDTDLF